MKNWNEYSKFNYPFDCETFFMPFEKEVSERIKPGFNIFEIGSGPGRFVDYAFKKYANTVTTSTLIFFDPFMLRKIAP